MDSEIRDLRKISREHGELHNTFKGKTDALKLSCDSRHDTVMPMVKEIMHQMNGIRF